MKGPQIDEYEINGIMEYRYVAGKICFSTFERLFKKLDELINLNCVIHIVKVGIYGEIHNDEEYYFVDDRLRDREGNIIECNMKYRSFQITYKL